MAILVTGGAGYIGSHMAHLLVDMGEDVVIIDDLSRGKGDLVPEQAWLVKGDVGDGPLLKRVLKTYDVDAVIHFAGFIVVPESVGNPLLYYERNTCAARTLIQAVVEADIKNFIFSSTASVYGAPEVIPIPEIAPLVPISPYGRSKLMTEQMLRDAEAAHGLRSVIMRYFNVAGADPLMRTGQVSEPPTHLVKIISQVALGLRSQLKIYGTDYPTPDGTCIRDYVHVSDLTHAHYLALNYLRSGGASDVFNCGYGRGYSVLDVIRAFESVVGTRMPHHYDARRPGDPPVLVADNRKILQALGWKPRHDSLETIVGTAYAWERKDTRFDEAVPFSQSLVG